MSTIHDASIRVFLFPDRWARTWLICSHSSKQRIQEETDSSRFGAVADFLVSGARIEKESANIDPPSPHLVFWWGLVDVTGNFSEQGNTRLVPD